MSRRSGRKTSQLKPINASLNAILSPERMMRLSGIGILRRRWADIVGTMMAERSEPIALEPQKDGSLGLIIAVDHSVIAQHIRLLHEDIRKACFRHSKIENLSKVWTRVQAGAGIREVKKEHKINTVTCKELRLFAINLQDVEDKSLRRLMFQAAIAQFTFQS